MKKITIVLSILLVFMFVYYIYDVDIKEKSNNIIENIKWCPDNKKVALKYENEYKIVDLSGRLLYTVEESGIKYKNYNWILLNGNWNFTEFKVDEIPKNLKLTKNKIRGELYDPVYNISGNIMITKTISNSTLYLIAVDKNTGEYNTILNLEDAQKIDVKYIDKYRTVVKVTENNIDRLYLMDIEKDYVVYNLSELKNIDLALKVLNLKEDSITTITNYRYNDIYINYLDIKKLKLVYNDLNTKDYYYIDYKNRFKIELSDIYSVAIDDDYLYLVCRTGDTFKIFQVDIKNNVYNNIYKSNNLIEDIRLVNGELYFTELNVVNNISAYKLFKYSNGKLKQICENSR
ncbi:MAG: hypothetical protein N2Z71_00510 [Caloramator sp.]|nr:hypothetical protein [Caloramator sp.]